MDNQLSDKMVELKKEFDAIFCDDYNIVWQWFSSKLEPTLLALTKLQADVLENYVPKSEYDIQVQVSEGLGRQYISIDEDKTQLKEYIKELKSEHTTELLKLSGEISELQLKLAIKEDAINASQIAMNEFIKQIEQLKAENEQLQTQLKNAGECYNEVRAENEKLSAQRNNGKVIVQYLDDNNYEEYDSFQEAKEAILESFTDKDEGIHPDIESIKVLQEIYKIEVPENPDGTYSIYFVPTKVNDELSQARQAERERIVNIIKSFDSCSDITLQPICKAITADKEGEKI